MNRTLLYIFAFTLLSLTEVAYAQAAYPVNKYQEQPNLPKAFLLGEYERPYEDLINIYEKSMLNLCDNNIVKAHEVWNIFLLEMEEYSKQVNFDLNGLKLYLNVFFNADGTIQNIVYFPKPNCKNIVFEHLTTFLIAFSKNYKLKYPLTDRCSHQSNASFPNFIRR